ncbi:MAG: MBL fold metallo-hydrolase [Sporocytophaga sp.]|uniref:MBL fold metallo-hydrolase n=1 Tax=Sporocytophaga sp. TaxID=2231183 RepID=UPI001B1C3384|nr:MBL fold metallo-hydrolase [Sporocytophaga sp.]MBO9700461.1 MBL fold metallo-hydrolase [Sporocytophaga sp.]
MKNKIHTHTSLEPMLKVNAFIVETSRELIIIDTTLTMSDSIALKQKAESLNKPIAGIVLTHGHPDHVAGTYNLDPKGNIPIYALPSVKELMEDTEEEKHKQWSGMFGSEWIPKWVYPNQMVHDGETVSIAGVNFFVIDIGSGGDSDANSIWLLEDENKAAFLGDFIYSNNHTYMNDGSILRWLANLERLSPVLKKFNKYFVGHGSTADFSFISKQKEYFLNYCGTLLDITKGTGTFDEETKKKFEQKIISDFPQYGCQFMVGLSADKVASELLSKSLILD